MSHPIRQILTFFAVFIFVVFVCFYGVTNNIDTYPAIRSETSVAVIAPNRTGELPDLAKYEPLLTLSREEFPIDEPGRRVIVVGDIHGMIQPLKKLLRMVNYDPSSDVVFHTGDILAKSGKKNSFKVLDFLIANNVRGVRGNHDQKVVEWRNWVDHIQTLPGGARWLERLERRWKSSKRKDDDAEEWVEEEALSSRGEDEKRLFKLIPKGWIMFSDHYKIARGLNDAQFQYLLDLPLRIYIPSAHVFIVHAGVLPLNPKRALEDKKRQPLARVPSMPRTPGPPLAKPRDVVEHLRNLQELAVLTEIPQNTDPWVTLNMRGIFRGNVERDNGIGRPWPDVWKECMQSCVGYGSRSRAFELDEVVVRDDVYLDMLKRKKKNHRLPCYPSTTIFGHAAARGLDVKRWSFGLDTGCVYGRKLTAMVIEGRDLEEYNYSPENILDNGINDEREDEDVDDDDFGHDVPEPRKIRPFGDYSEAKFYSVKC